MKLQQRAANDVRLMEDEIRQVVAISLRVQEGQAVLGRRFAEDLRNGEELEEPVPVVQHLPVEERARRAPISVDEWMIVRQPEMQDDRADHWMNEILRRLSIRELAHEFHAPRKF